ncbi:MAG: SDR family oxidoreductase [Actinobacteria bacterium]|nr:SDR family oxidoreductase [Actinomycetota bacterium]MBU4241506.1 SDR family oxidoreductase [Actinomycetota bacterium]MBU4386263.1 SDR family oxidoreductase [Actinomycetota bacterium]MBU4489701.1 SDR family oxidoreductase [Actinomycetota bacterium]MCG2795475.1 SDR family oxidoreductase [Actinomycetes bacterium]
MADEIRFDDRVAVVTGAGGGLGRSHALLLASLGAKVVVNDLGGSMDGEGSGSTPAEQVVDEIKAAGGEATPNYESVSEWESAQKIIGAAIDTYGKIDILINNAGILRDKSMMKMEIKDWELVIAVHLAGTFFCTKAALPNMRENSYGRILSTASAAGLYGNFGQTNYGAAKMGIAGMMNSVKLEGAKYNIKANTLVPIAGTRLTATIMPSEVVEQLKPEYVSPLTAYLCCEQCELSGAMMTAGAGYFSRAAVVEGPGVFFEDAATVTVDDISAKIADITTLEGAVEYDSATAQTGHALSKIKFD